MNRLGKVGAVDVGDKAERHIPLAVMFQRLVGHHRPEIGTADADVDDVRNAFARVPRPNAAPDPLAKVRHAVEYGVDLGDHVLTINDEWNLLWVREGPRAGQPDFP